jgi:ribA/ribD-fused uncharacterized protein
MSTTDGGARLLDDGHPHGGKPIMIIYEFNGAHRFLSNFYPCIVVYEGVHYRSTEHAFAAAKTLNPYDRLRIAAASSAVEAKRLGRGVELREDWDQRVRFDVMRDLLAIKFSPSSELAALLIATGDAELIEGNTWHDQIWGDCRCGRRSCAAPGQNHLGKMLMTRRAQLSDLNAHLVR